MGVVRYIKASDDELMRLGKHELIKLAEGRSKRSGRAEAELERRRVNKVAKRNARRKASA